ncbi:MAG: HlyD family efflux transporter periplasmic adaptor subunit [Clostridia bacterium]|nr:HlyD family efflux transporter periplasmic adaptor subunit [Clostridia bacterium]
MSETIRAEGIPQQKAESAAGTRKKKRSRKKTVRRIIWTVVILALLGTGAWLGYTKLRADYQVTYDAYTATTGSISNSLNFSGSMQLINSRAYTASGDQKVKDVYVSVGQKVAKGAKLIRLSGGETLTADFDGTVSAVEVETGDEVASGAALLTLADFDHMKVSVRIGESDISSVAVGDACRVTVSSAGASYDAAINAIDYATYSGNNVAYYTATILVDTGKNANVYPGMQATVTVPQEEANNVIVLKMDALSTARDNTAFVFKQAADGTMTESPVTVGVSNGNYVEIKSGLTEGETVYKVAPKTETQTGLAGLFSGLFGSQQVNQQQNAMRPGNMPNGQNGNWNNRQRNTNGTGGTGGNNGGSRGN